MTARRKLTWVVGALVALAALGFGAVLLYAKVINDSPDAFDEGDLAEALATTTTTIAAVPSTSAPDAAPPVTTPVTTTPVTTAPPTTAAAVGPSTWTVTDASAVGYRIKEVLVGVDTEGVGRTNQITGSLTLDGTVLTAAEFTVDVASISSDDGRRDGAFRGPIMRTELYPTATFVLTEPVELGTQAVDGTEVTVSATGDLTLRDVTKAVTFELTGRMENGQVGVLGSIPVVFADYGIENPSSTMVTTEDHGLLEFVLVFTPVS